MKHNRNKLVLFFFGFILFSSYGGFLVFQSVFISGVEETQTVKITPTHPRDINNISREEFSETEKTDDSEKPLEFNPAQGRFNYGVQPGTPVTVTSWTHDCNWMGVGGQVFDGDYPANNIIVELGGSFEGENLLGLSMIGLNQEYGLSGYEIQISDHPVNSSNTIWIRLLDLTGMPLSDKLYLSTDDQCSKNLILVNFNQIETPTTLIHYFPIIF